MSRLSREEAAHLPELDAFVEYQQVRNLSPVTIELRSRAIRHFAAWLGRPLALASVADLRAYVAGRRDEIANSSQASEISYLKAFYSGLVELGLVDTNPADGIHSWKPVSNRQPLSLLCVRALLLEARRVRGTLTPRRKALAQRDRAALELLFATGMRASEVVATQVVDLDLEQGLVLVRRAKAGTSRRLPLPEPAVEALRSYVEEGRAVLLKTRTDPGSLLLGATGRALEQPGLGYMVKRVAKRCDTHAFPHLFRRTIATELARAGVSLPSIQKVLGHSSMSITSEYVTVHVDQMRSALEAVVSDRPACRPGAVKPLELQRRLFTACEVPAA